MTDHPDHPPKEVHFTVDNEPFSTSDAVQTPNQIITTYAELDAKTHYLVRVHGHDTESFKDKGEVPITISNGDHFQCISTGPTPVSDPAVQVGVAAFAAGLRELGYNAQPVPGHPDAVQFAYEVPTGKFAGKTYMVGILVPPDFPGTAPSGPHVNPHVVPISDGNGEHPHRAHRSPFGSEWQYWSRPIRDWARSRTVKAYMAHVFQLWHTQ